jgi:hypothetical protein
MRIAFGLGGAIRSPIVSQRPRAGKHTGFGGYIGARPMARKEKTGRTWPVFQVLAAKAETTAATHLLCQPWPPHNAPYPVHFRP